MDEDAKHFRQYVRLYNNMFAFTSLGGNFDAKTKKRIYVFKLHSQIYHYIPNLVLRDAGPNSPKTDRNISARKYYAYKLQCRPNNLLLRSGRCFQQYIVDMYVKLENTRLDFFRKNLQTIRDDLYQGLLDTIDCGENCAANVGRRIILPATFIGGPRDLKKRYLNAMSLV
ncbi:uncharacterized protein LOC110734763 [Chenopodium quinoa]|uniref:uncharacterized protein LOC110734763 n=1 Tax=Chenopodium quinoa TaxID=63459 RepID=UPI000B776A69|nr:uncharacterized protein LOC110734763 [Chenopodium quinoa]